MRLRFDFEWMFSKDVSGEAQTPDFNDSDWEQVDVPHDFSIEGPMDESNPGGASVAWFPGGVGWYRKSFTLPEQARGQRVFVDFDGIYWKSDVWINGHHLGFRPNGYIGFRYELTPFLDFHGSNVIAVRADNSEQPNSRWYSGSGIYRHCYLEILNPLHIAHWGTYITTPEVNAEHGSVAVEVTVENQDLSQRNAVVAVFIRDPEGQVVAQSTTRCECPAESQQVARLGLEVDSPRLWSPEEPNLYSVETRLEENGILLDSKTDPLGFRWFVFDEGSGFFLNGQRVPLKGVCIHQSTGGVGAAMPDRVLERQLELLKEMGCNAIRSSHYPHAPELLEMCNRMGFLYIDEFFDEWFVGKRTYSYHRFFHEWWERDLADQIRCNRNHPCIVLWSIGNENLERKMPEGAEMARQLAERVRQLEPTRPVTAAINYIHEANESGLAQALDVVGYNGGGGSVFHCHEDKARFPERLMYASENPHTYATRGVYRTHSRHRNESGLEWTKMETREVAQLTAEEVFPFFDDAFHSCYDNAYVRTCIRDSWQWIVKNGFMAGEFRWTGFDYLGESHGWPARTSNAGVLDLCGFPKDCFYLYQRLWTDAPMLHILPHWTWPQLEEGTIIPVWAYSNCDTVELFFNGKSLGEKTVDGLPNLEWRVPYHPGALRAIAKKGGRIVCVQEQRTAGEADRIELTVDRPKLRAGGQDVAHVSVRVLDSKGTMVPHADHRIHFTVEGAAKLIGVENGDPIDLDSCKLSSRKAFMGMCLAIVQSVYQPGTIRISASGEGLEPASLEVHSCSEPFLPLLTSAIAGDSL